MGTCLKTQTINKYLVTFKALFVPFQLKATQYYLIASFLSKYWLTNNVLNLLLMMLKKIQFIKGDIKVKKKKKMFSGLFSTWI